MVQGCNINILDTMKAPTMKAVKVATEEQKRLAQLSHIERIDQVEDSLITRMVEITSHTYEECAMELRGTDMDMETAINNLLEGNAEEWQTTKKKVRPEKPPKVIAPEVETPVVAKTRDSTRGRSNSRGRGRGGSTTDRLNDKDKITDKSVEEKNRRNRERTNYSDRGRGAAGRGRAGKRQLPPRMDRQRYSNSRDGSDGSTYRGRGGYNRGGRANHYRDRGAENNDKEPNWEENTGEDNWSSKAEGWAASDAAESPGWGPPKDEVIEDAKEAEAEQWTDAVENQTEPPVVANGDAHTTEAHPAPDFSTEYSLTTSLPAEVPAVETTRKRPAYTQAFTKSFSQTTAPTSLSSLITSTNDSFTSGAPTSTVFSDPKTSAFSESFAFSQAQSTVDSLSSCLDSVPDYASRHEQATLKNEDRQSDLKMLQEALNNNSALPSAGRKISVEQLFQTQIGTMHDKPITSVPESLEERLSPASPPTSSTSSNNSARRSKRPQRSIPTEPVEMPGHTMESLDVQFGSIGFMDNTEEEEALECPEIEKTPCVSKTDAATSTTPGAAATTPHSAVSTSSTVYTSSSPFTAPQETLTEIPGIHQVGPLRDPAPQSLRDPAPQSPQQSSAVAPPNLPPPNIDNIRSANNLITQLPNSEEEERAKSLLEQQRSHIATSYSNNTSSSYPQQQQQQQAQSKREAKSLPPGVSMYPNPQQGQVEGSALRPSVAALFKEATGAPQHQQPLMRPHYNYNSQGSFESNQAGVYEQPQHTQHHKYYNHLQSNYESQQSHQMTQHASREPSSYSQSQSEHNKQYSRSNSDHLTSTSSYHQPAAHIGAGLTSGITHTGNNVAHSAHSAAGIAGTGVAGYPPVMGHYYSFPPAPYHNMYAGAPNAYYPHFSPAHAQPIGFAQQQAKQSSNVGGYPTNANSHYGEATTNHTANHQYHTSAQYDDSYKDMYSQSSTKQHQLPVTTSTPSDFTKMGMPEKNMFNVGFMHYPANNFFPQLQQTQQAQQAALLQRGLTTADQPSARSSQQPGAALNPSAKHYNWAHR